MQSRTRSMVDRDARREAKGNSPREIVRDQRRWAFATPSLQIASLYASV